MAVPETAMHKDRHIVARQNNIRLAGKILHVQPEPKPCPVKSSAYLQLGFGVLAANSCHHAAANLWRDDVRQLLRALMV